MLNTINRGPGITRDANTEFHTHWRPPSCRYNLSTEHTSQAEPGHAKCSGDKDIDYPRHESIPLPVSFHGHTRPASRNETE